MMSILKLLILVLFCNFTFSQDISNDLSLNVENDMLFYLTEKNKYSHYSKILVKITLRNHSKFSYLIPIDTSTFNIYDAAKEFEIELDGRLFGSPITIFRPWMKVYDSLNNEVPTYFSSPRPDLESDEFKEEFKLNEERLRILIIEREEAYDKYGSEDTEERIDMPEFYYFLKKHQYIVGPEQSIEVTIPVMLPENKLMLGNFREGIALKNHESYKAVIEIDYTYNSLDKMLTQKDKDSLKKADIKVFNGVLRSNEIDLVPIKD